MQLYGMDALRQLVTALVVHIADELITDDPIMNALVILALLAGVVGIVLIVIVF
jgi:hypothetical protein